MLQVRLVNKNLDIRSSFSNVVSVIFRPDRNDFFLLKNNLLKKKIYNSINEFKLE